MTIILDNAPRGCGKLKKGACYATATAHPGGNLRAWTWILGEPWEGGHYVDGAGVPPRTQIEVNPSMSLTWEYIWRYEWTKPGYDSGTGCPPLDIPGFGIADHVGSKFYTPLAFARECAMRGPSRRLTPSNAKKWAKRVPFPIVFTTNQWPVHPSKEKLEEWLFAQVKRENDASENVYSDIYRTFREILSLPADYLDSVYSSAYSRHVYSEEELGRFRSRWR